MDNFKVPTKILLLIISKYLLREPNSLKIKVYVVIQDVSNYN